MKSKIFEAPSVEIIHICEENIICTSNIIPQFVQGTGATSAGQADFNTLWGN